MDYVGTELELFSQAANWKTYVAGKLLPYIRGRVLEVGAGIEATIERLASENVEDWLALEPDAKLAQEISRRLRQGDLPRICRIAMAGLKALTPGGCSASRLFMLDSIGFFLALANRLVLRSANPTPAPITTWDRWIVPLSRMFDPLTRFRFGKSVIVVRQAAT